MAGASSHGASVEMAHPPLDLDSYKPRIAIIDIGSNSVRLVVYQGLTRAPAILFNEKVVAGLGRGMDASNMLSDDAMDLAVGGIARFVQLADAMEVDSLRAVATAAVRAAANGPAFVARVMAETGIKVEIISGEAEARGAALGVIAGIPAADGVVGDMGGGSLELVRVADGQAHERVSLPFGSLKLDVLRRESPRNFVRLLEKEMEGIEWIRKGRGKPFYAVGGSWRALAHLHMHLSGWPLPAVHHHVMPINAPERLVRTLSQISLKSLRQVPSMSSTRAPHLMGAALLMKVVTRTLGSSSIIMSAYGLREGLLYAALPKAAQKEDPLITAAREEASRSARFWAENEGRLGDELLAFTDPLFPDESPAERRIRLAAAILAETAWRAHPDKRAEHGYDMAIQGNWVGITSAERAILATTLFVVNGGKVPGRETSALQPLAPPEAFERARLWGLGLRLGLRLGGGSVRLIARSCLQRGPRNLRLSLEREFAALYGESVRRRHRILAQALNLEPELHLLDREVQARAS